MKLLVGPLAGLCAPRNKTIMDGELHVDDADSFVETELNKVI